MSIFSAAKAKNTRFPLLDMLRGMAVLLVIFRHWTLEEHLARAGWLGVDLFFVISGFLISGLLFTEHEKHGKIGFLRFFIRRGLKIYPLFFLVVIIPLVGFPSLYSALVKELLFIQNYFGGFYIHTWSLAIEEHFYLLLMSCFALLYKPLQKNFYLVCIFFMIAPLGLRLWHCSDGNCFNHFYTHTRIDSLFTGVLACWIWKFHPQKISFLTGNIRYVILLICVGFLASFGWIEPENTFTQGIGFTLIAWACAAILLCCLHSKSTGKAVEPLAFLGYYSYAIYLMHVPALLILRNYGITEKTNDTLFFPLYLALSILLGLLGSELIEQPILRWRNRVFPSKA